MSDDPTMGQPHEPGRATPADAAGLGARIGARLLDVVLVGIPASIIVGLLGLGADPTGFASIVFAVLWFGYFVLLESNRGATVGKSILSIKVVGPNGGNPEIAETAKRNVWMLLGLIPFLGPIASLAAVIAIIVTISSSSENRGWHDTFAGTSVLRAA